MKKKVLKAKYYLLDMDPGIYKKVKLEGINTYMIESALDILESNMRDIDGFCDISWRDEDGLKHNFCLSHSYLKNGEYHYDIKTKGDIHFDELNRKKLLKILNKIKN